MPKLKNVSLPITEYRVIEATRLARATAQASLRLWYNKRYSTANAKFRQEQKDANSKKVASIPGWSESEGNKSGYIMLCSIMDQTLEPIVLVLDYETVPSGGLTYRERHKQIRAALRLENKVSLRMIPFRPWYRYYTQSEMVPEYRAIPCSDIQCTKMLGTSLMYYAYVHRR